MSADTYLEPTEPELQTEYTFDALGRLLSVRHFFPWVEPFDYIYEDEDAISHDGLSADDIDFDGLPNREDHPAESEAARDEQHNDSTDCDTGMGTRTS